ncbi:hypothetical protein [Tenacibaculum sp. nBUS_03]|uniref:hypothetical protein n=1 Tax=Tenacibaculum sp. nBUS_03 TaxID=3395320 RepID=UPI003EB894CD
MIPDASLYLRDSGFTYKYLTSKKAIKIINSKSIFALNPLFTTFIKKDSTGLLFHTLKESLLNSRKIKNKFALSFNVASYNKFDRGVYNISNEQFRLIEKIEGVITNENKVKVKVSLLNKDQNFAFQFLN